MIQAALWGVPLPRKTGVLPGVPAPWKVAGGLAAQVHAIDPGLVRELVPVHETLRAHALAEIAVLERASEPELRRALAWAMENLPPEEPGVFLHGDLLGQNVLLRPEEPTALLDWDRAQIGHPAYDLAILTRGVQKPYKEAGGREKLLAAYRAAGGREISWREVRIFELAMIAGWYRETVESDPRSGEVEQLLRRIEKLTP
jgi:aminoglycoside phosphotransferase (APT) family kinase protein